MSTPSRRAYEVWKEADNAARAAESRLAHRWEDYFAHRRPPPGADLISEVSRLRATANDRLSRTMVAMGGSSGDSTFPGHKPSSAQEKGPRTAEAE